MKPLAKNRRFSISFSAIKIVSNGFSYSDLLNALQSWQNTLIRHNWCQKSVFFVWKVGNQKVFARQIPWYSLWADELFHHSGHLMVVFEALNHDLLHIFRRSLLFSLWDRPIDLSIHMNHIWTCLLPMNPNFHQLKIINTPPNLNWPRVRRLPRGR